MKSTILLSSGSVGAFACRACLFATLFIGLSGPLARSGDSSLPRIGVSAVGEQVTVAWDAPHAKLEAAQSLAGPWSLVTTAGSSYEVTPSELSQARQFYRLRLPPAGKKWLTVAAVTMCAKPDTEANLQTFFAYMEQASSEGADLVVFPEIALQQNPGWGGASYSPTQAERDYVQQTAEPVPGESTSRLAERAKELNMYVAFGMTEADEEDSLYNTSVFLGPEGVIGKHRKKHLWDAGSGGNEHLFWKRGVDVEVVDSPIGKVGLIICVEMWHYLGWELGNKGAELLVTVSAWPRSNSSLYDRVTSSNARDARCWHVVANQVGWAGHASDCGSSRVITPTGQVISDTGASEGMAIGETDLLIDE